MSEIEIRLLDEALAIGAAYRVMHQLRPHLAQHEFVEAVLTQQVEGYQLAALFDDGVVRAVAGYRLQHMLAHGRFLYVDDLVTDEASRSARYGERLFAWLMEQARSAGCRSLQLDSGVQRNGAHRFYFARRMRIASYHFAVDL